MERNPKAVCSTCPFYRPFSKSEERIPDTGQCRANPPCASVSPVGEVGTAWAEVNATDWCRTHPKLFIHGDG